ncbi:hypothetical protein HY638_00140 [Candidatus Woesearchaeota archaeon]|nr:hypothetical protein [Candidatus Woesearchaeota archaeon]
MKLAIRTDIQTGKFVESKIPLDCTLCLSSPAEKCYETFKYRWKRGVLGEIVAGFLRIGAVIALLMVLPAAAFKVDITPAEVSIPTDGVARFNVTITNTGDFSDTFRVFSLLYPDWDLRTDPIENPIKVEVGPGETKTKGVLFEPLHVVGIGTYVVGIKVESEGTGLIISVPRRVSLSSGPSEGQYVPTVTINANAPEEVSPGKDFEIDLDIKNQNILSLEELKLVITTRNGLFYKEMDLSLAPKEGVLRTVSVNLDPFTQPQKDVLSVEIRRGNETISSATRRMDVIQYSEITQKRQEDSFLLKGTETVTFTNKGNVKYDGPVTLEYSWYLLPIISTEPDATYRYEDGKSLFEWSISLEPGESKTIVWVTNYRIIAYVLVLIAILLVLYAQLRSPLILEKTSSNIQMKEGGISDMKVIITIKNRGKSAVKSIVVTDKVPRIGHVKKGFDIGTLQPSKVLTHENKGTMLKWDVDHVDVGEERVIAYRITAGLPITGGLELPSASAKFSVGIRQVTARSNPLRID